MNDLQERLKEFNISRTIILGVGSRLRSDDAVGSVIAERLSGLAPERIYDVGTVPENYLGKILKNEPDNIIFIDAMHFEAEPGEYRLFKMSELYDGYLSTHGSSLSFLIELLGNDRPVESYVLGIEPEFTGVGESISDIVREAAEDIISIFAEWIKKEGGKNSAL